MGKLIILILVVLSSCGFISNNLKNHVGNDAQIINLGPSMFGYGYFEWRSKNILIKNKDKSGELDMMTDQERNTFENNLPLGDLIFHCERSDSDYSIRIRIEDSEGNILSDDTKSSSGFGLNCSGSGCIWNHVFVTRIREDVKDYFTVTMNDKYMKKTFKIRVQL